MPLTFFVVGAGVLVGYLRGGRIRRIGDAGLIANALLFVGLAVQLGVDLTAARFDLAGPLALAGLVLSQVLIAGWILANRYRPGIVLVFVGLLLNAVVIAANGSMPVDPVAIERAGLVGEPPPGKHEIMTEDSRLTVLADVHPLPPLRTVVSVGDAVLAAGLLSLVGHLMTYRTPAERRGGRRSGSGELDGVGEDDVLEGGHDLGVVGERHLTA